MTLFDEPIEFDPRGRPLVRPCTIASMISARGDASFGHQKISTAVSSICFISHRCKLLRVMLATEDAGGTLLHVHQLEQTKRRNVHGLYHQNGLCIDLVVPPTRADEPDIDDVELSNGAAALASPPEIAHQHRRRCPQ
jgi:hypothetical protein